MTINLEGKNRRYCHNRREYYACLLESFYAIEKKNREEKEKWEKNGRKGEYAHYYLNNARFTPDDGQAYGLNYRNANVSDQIDLLEDILSQPQIIEPTLRSLRERAERKAQMTADLAEVQTLNSETLDENGHSQSENLNAAGANGPFPTETTNEATPPSPSGSLTRSSSQRPAETSPEQPTTQQAPRAGDSQTTVPAISRSPDIHDVSSTGSPSANHQISSSSPPATGSQTAVTIQANQNDLSALPVSSSESDGPVAGIQAAASSPSEISPPAPPSSSPSGINASIEEQPNDGIFNALRDVTIQSEPDLQTQSGQTAHGRYKDGVITLDETLLNNGSDAQIIGVLAEEYGEHLLEVAQPADVPGEDTGGRIGERLINKLINQANASPDGKARLTAIIDGEERTLEATAEELEAVLTQNFTDERINNPLEDDAGRYMGEALSNMSFRDKKTIEYTEENEERYWPLKVIEVLGEKTELESLGMVYKLLPNGEVDYESGFKLTPVSAFKHWLYGKGETLRVDFVEVFKPVLEKLYVNVAKFKDFYWMCSHGAGEYQVDELRWPVATPGDWDLVFGNVSFKFIGNVIYDGYNWSAKGVYRCYDDTYDFHGSSHRTLLSEARVRFVEMIIKGIDYDIEIRGELPMEEKGLTPPYDALVKMKLAQENKYTKFTKIK